MHSPSRFGRAAVAIALTTIALATTAGVARAEDATVLAPVDPAVTAALLADSVDVAAGVSDVRVLTVLAMARAQVGKPYVFGARGPDGFDCSGLVDYVYLSLIHISEPTRPY